MTRDLRKYARQTNSRLLAGFFVLVFGLGLGLIYWLWGPDAALVGLICLLGALVPAALVWLVLAVMGWVARKAQE
jgi:hypothetical protein